MKFKFIRVANPFDKTQDVVMAKPILEKRITIRQIADELATTSTHSKGEVLGLLEDLGPVVARYIAMGHSVDLGGLGALRPTFSAKGIKLAKGAPFDGTKFNILTQLKAVKAIFTAGADIKDAYKAMRFERSTGEAGECKAPDEDGKVKDPHVEGNDDPNKKKPEETPKRPEAD